MRLEDNTYAAYAEALAPIPGEDTFKIDARALHSWLGINEQFNQWVARRIKEYRLTDGEDFWCCVTKTRGRPRKDYRLTIDTAKELAMVERTEVGRETRCYFIRMERTAMQMASVAALRRQNEPESPEAPLRPPRGALPSQDCIVERK